MQTKVKTLMTRNPKVIAADSSLKDAARLMKDIECGVLPVGSEDDPEGVITDRDIVIRAVARGMDAATEKVRDYMTKGVQYCRENDTLEEAAGLMREHNVNRLLVRDDSGRLCGIISFGSLLRKDSDPEEVSEIVERAVGRKEAA